MNKSEYRTPKKNNPYISSTLIERWSFLYMFPIFYRTYKKGFREDDLFEALEEHKSAYLGDKMEELWTKEHKISNKYALHKALFKMFATKTILAASVKLIAELGLVTIAPYAVGKLVSYFEENQTKISQRDASIYAALIGLTYLIVSIIFHPAMMVNMHISMKMRICCGTLIYRKALRLSRNALAKTTIGQIVNLLSNDVTKFEQGFANIEYILISPVQAAVAFYMLQREIGIAALFGLMLLIGFVPLQIYVGKISCHLRHKTAMRTDERVKLMNEIICGMQVIKMYCWEKPFAKLIAFARRKEMSVIRSHSYLMGMLYSQEMFSTRTSVFISLLSYVLLGNNITAEKVFLVTSIYSAIRPTLTIMFSLACSNLAEIHISIKRINNFLCLDELTNGGEYLHTNGISKQNGDNFAEELTLKLSNSINGIDKPKQVDSEKNSITNGTHDIMKIEMKNLSAKWDLDSPDNTLDKINLNISSSQLVAIIGPIGSGKSSLLNVILKEIQIVEGQANISGIISYAPQEPWLFSGSIRNNILFGEPYDKRRYAEVVRTCSLKSDFLLFPYGDKTLVGERGSALSGGQKARINLARCIYKKADIYLLDDPLSAVDAKVGKNLYQDCVRIFLYNKLRILVTHQVQYLKSADSIIIMNNGTIDKTGTYEQLKNSDLDYADILKTTAVEEEKKVNSRKNSRQMSLLQSIEDVQSEPEVLQELLTEGNVKVSTYFKLIRSGGKFYCIVGLLLVMIMARFFEYGSDVIVRTWVNLEQSPDSTNATSEDFRPKIIYMYSGFTLGTIIFSLGYCLAFVAFFTNASINLHNTVVAKMIESTMNFFDNNSSGRILNRFSKDLGILDEYIPFLFYDVVAIIVLLSGTVIMSIFVEPWLLLLCLVLFIVLCTCRNFYVVTSRNIKRLEGITRSPIYSHTNTSIYGLSTIRAFKAQKLLQNEFDAIQDKHSSTWFLFIASNRCFGYWLDIICISFVTSSIYVLIFYSKNVYAGDVGMIFNQFLTLLLFLQWGMRQWSELENQMTSVERILEYTKIEVEPKREKRNYINWPEHGKVEFQNVFFRYSSQDLPVLKNLCFVIEPKQKVGIVGRTGAGKSSTISAVFQLYEVEGKILIDDKDITKMCLNEVRSKISIIPQEPVLFSGTLRRNLDPFDEYDDELLWNALEQVELKPAIVDLGSGLNCPIVEGGSNFSMGQRQLVCLARALVRKNKILVLDEATANVDPQTDNLIQTTIRTSFRDCTVLTIAHRLNTVMDSDKILVLDNGSVAEFDHPHELLERNAGLLHELVEATGEVSSKNLRNIARNAYLNSNQTSNQQDVLNLDGVSHNE